MKSPKNLNLIDRLKFLFKDSIVYGGAASINKFIALFTFPLLTRYFSVEEYGIIDAFTVLSTLLVTVLIFGQDSAVARYFYEFEDKKIKKDVITQSLTIQLVTIFAIIPFLAIYSSDLARMYVDSEVAEKIIIIILVQIPFGLLINFSGNILKWTFEKYKFIFLKVGSTSSYLLSIAIGLYFFKMDIVSVFYFFLATQIIFGLFGIIFVRKWLSIKFSSGNYKKLLLYGLPYGVICILGASLPAIDRYFISKYLSSNDLGLYAAGYKIALILNLPIQAFQTAWGPFYLSIHKEQNAEKTYNSILILYSIIFSFFALLLIIFSEKILILLSGIDYQEGSIVVYPLALAIIFRNLNSILGVGIDLSKKSYLKIYSYVIGLTTSIASIILTIEALGILGVGISILLGEISKSVVEAYLGSKVYNIKFNYYSMIVIFSLIILMIVSVFLIDKFLNASMSTKVGLYALILISPLLSKFVRNKISTIINIIINNL